MERWESLQLDNQDLAHLRLVSIGFLRHSNLRHEEAHPTAYRMKVANLVRVDLVDLADLAVEDLVGVDLVLEDLVLEDLKGAVVVLMNIE